MGVKVLHILNELRWSGAEVMLCSAASLWLGRGYELDILSTGETVGVYANSLAAAGYRVHHIPFRKNPEFAWALLRLLNTESYHAVHIHTERANFLYGVVARLVGTPVIVRTVHSVFAFSGWLRLERAIQRALLSQSGVIHVSVSNSVYANEMRRFRNSTMVVPNCYDANRIVPPTRKQRAEARARLGIKDHKFVICTVGNCSPVKNHEALLLALTDLRSELDVLYLHVGQEDAETSERRLAHSLGLETSVRFLGYQDPLPILWASDVFVMPSKYEGFGVAAIEALGAGVPAILAKVPGLEDLRLFETGIRWTEPEPNAIARELRALGSCPRETRIQLGLQAHLTARKHFGIERGAAAYAALYESMGTRRQILPRSRES